MNSFDDENEIPNFKDTAIWQKGMDIAVLTHKIAELIDEIDEESPLGTMKGIFKESALIIPAKIAGAIGMGIYDLKMENATIVRKCARELGTTCTSLKMFGFKEEAYLNLLREEIEALRLLFIEWVAGFDQFDYVVDRWGLFNPPGVGPDDVDVDDY